MPCDCGGGRDHDFSRASHKPANIWGVNFSRQTIRSHTIRFTKYLLGDIGFGFAYDPYVIHATEIYYLVFGTLTLLGGIVGYIKVKSLPSLVLGIVYGIALISAGILLFNGSPDHLKNVKVGLIVGLLATAGLAGQFIPKVMVNRAAPHVIVMALLSAVGMALTLIAFSGK